MSKPTTSSSIRATVVVLSDPQGGGDEALGRVFNALAVVHEIRQRGGDARLVFQGAGARWPAVLADAAHPAHDLYMRVEGSLAGVSCGCADVFGAGGDVDELGIERLRSNPAPGTSGMHSLLDPLLEGRELMIF